MVRRKKDKKGRKQDGGRLRKSWKIKFNICQKMSQNS